MFMSKGKRYTQEFKIEAVKQTTERGYSVAEVSERLGICTKTLYHWRSQLSDKPKPSKSADEQLRIAKLEAELKRVTEERDILKKAARYFVSSLGALIQPCFLERMAYVTTTVVFKDIMFLIDVTVTSKAKKT